MKLNAPTGNGAESEIRDAAGYPILLLLATLGVVMANGTIANAAENASNPLASVNNLDLRWQYTSADAGDTHDTYIDGAYMILPDLKFKYELHYKFTDTTGSNRRDFEKVSIKPIYFPYLTKLNETWGMKVATGIEWIVDFDNEEQGIGTGSDQLAPLVGLAFSNLKTGLALIPLMQHFESYNGNDLSQTSMRLIALQPFGDGYWSKLDLKIPYDWENERVPASGELQIGYNMNNAWAIYVDGLLGIGTARTYDAGAGLGLRFKF